MFHKGVQVYTAPQIQFGTGREDVKHRYRVFSDRFIKLDTEVEGRK
jgi:hypothetical protein